jgi:hypothetical protein
MLKKYDDDCGGTIGMEEFAELYADLYSEHQRSRKPWWIVRFLTLLVKHMKMGSVVFRVCLAYAQCMSVMLRFNNVSWPAGFITYLGVLEYTTIEIFALLPLECETESRCVHRSDRTYSPPPPA